MAEKIIQPAFGCPQYPKAGRNTQHKTLNGVLKNKHSTTQHMFTIQQLDLFGIGIPSTKKLFLIPFISLLDLQTQHHIILYKAIYVRATPINFLNSNNDEPINQNPFELSFKARIIFLANHILQIKKYPNIMCCHFIRI